MKTSEEWARTPHIQHGEDFREYIKSIQLDAMKEGAKRAEAISRKQYEKGFRYSETAQLNEGVSKCEMAIYKAYSMWTENDL